MLCRGWAWSGVHLSIWRLLWLPGPAWIFPLASNGSWVLLSAPLTSLAFLGWAGLFRPPARERMLIFCLEWLGIPVTFLELCYLLGHRTKGTIHLPLCTPCKGSVPCDLLHKQSYWGPLGPSRTTSLSRHLARAGEDWEWAGTNFWVKSKGSISSTAQSFISLPLLYHPVIKVLWVGGPGLLYHVGAISH